MCKNTCRVSFFLVACTLLFSNFRPILCEEDGSTPLMEDLNQLRLPRRELADTHTGDFPNQKKLSISIKRTVGGSQPTSVGGTRPARGGGSTPTRGGGSTPTRGGGSPPVRDGGSTPTGSGGSPPVRDGGSTPAGGGGSPPVIGSGAAGSRSKSGGSRTSSSFNRGCVLSIVILLGSFL